MKKKDSKDSSVLANKNEATSSAAFKKPRASRAKKASDSKQAATKSEPIEQTSEDSLKENKQKTSDVEMMSSEDDDDDFEEVESEEEKPKKKSSKKPTNKSTAKTKKEPKKAESTIKKQSPKKEPIMLPKTGNILDDIDALLAMETKPKHIKQSNMNSTIDEDDDSDFEEVEMGKGEEHLAQMLKRATPLEVNIQTKKARKEVDYAAKVERMFRAAQKQLRIATIKTHLVCWITHGLYLNKLCSDQVISAQVMSLNLKPKKFQLVNFNKKLLCEFLSLVSKQFKLNEDDSFNKSMLITRDSLSQVIGEQKCANFLQYILIVLVVLRNSGVKARLCVCFDVIPMTQEKVVTSKEEEVEKAEKKPVRATTSKKKNKKILSEDEEELESDESEETKSKKSKKRKSETEIKAKPVKKSKKESERLSSKLSQLETSDDEDYEVKQPNSPKSTNQSEDRFYWIEVYLEEEKTWIPVNPFDLKLKESSEEDLEKRFGKQVLYVCGFDNDQRVKDITKRYASDWEVSTRLMRISHLEEKKLWYEKMLLRLKPIDASLDMEEEKQLKDHPYYLLKKNLLKFQSVYPENALPVGKFRNENVYSRDNLVTLHSRQTWLKYARVVKPYEKAYKIVKGRLKASEYKQGLRENPDLDLYGYWQTKMFEPPFAENGRIPRNEFGNVELFQPCMLPIGCVHLKGYPNMNKVCRKLKVDCVAAVVGFDAHGGFSHAVTDGWVICAEHEEAVLAAYEQEEIEANKRLIEKQQERVLNNWKKLVKGVLIREKLKLKYGNKISTQSGKCLDKDDDHHDEEVKIETARVQEIKVDEEASKPKVAPPTREVPEQKEIIKIGTKSKKSTTKSAPKTETKNTQKTNRGRGKRKSADDEEDEEDYVDEESESDYEERNRKKRKNTAKKPAPARKQSARNVKKAAIVVDDEIEEVDTKREDPQKESIQSNANNQNNDDDDLNLSDED